MSKDKALEALNEMYAVLNDSDRWCEHKRIIIEALQPTLDEDVQEALIELDKEIDFYEHYASIDDEYNELCGMRDKSIRKVKAFKLIKQALQSKSTTNVDVSYAIKVLRRALNEEVFTSRITPNEALDIIVKALQSEVENER